MLIFERSVTKEYWSAMHAYIMRRLQTGRYEPVGNTGVMHVFGGQTTCTYAIVVNGWPVAWLYLGRRPTWHAWEVRQVWVFPELRGHGLASKIYRAAVNTHGIILASGKTQSKTSRALWARFVRLKTLDLYANDFNDLDQRSQVWYEDGEIQSN